MGIMTNRNAYRGRLGLFLVALIVLTGLQPALAQDREWIGAPIEEIRKAAEDGDATAQYELAWDYDLGLMVPEDHAEAVKWYRLAAEQGHVEAQGRLGLKYDLGEGVKKDDWEAVKWYRLAAEQGHVEAQYALGLMYGKGKGVLENYQEAVKWYRMAAEQGHAIEGPRRGGGGRAGPRRGSSKVGL